MIGLIRAFVGLDAWTLFKPLQVKPPFRIFHLDNSKKKLLNFFNPTLSA